MFANCNSNSSGRDLAKSIGDVHVKYGVNTTNQPDDSGEKLTFGHPDSVRHPKNGMRFDR